MRRTLTHEEVIQLSLLLHKADEEGGLSFKLVTDGGYMECGAFFMDDDDGYMVVVSSIPGGKTSFGVGTVNEAYVEHTVGTHEFCPELMALCDWIKQRAESAKKADASTEELIILVKSWIG